MYQIVTYLTLRKIILTNIKSKRDEIKRRSPYLFVNRSILSTILELSDMEQKTKGGKSTRGSLNGER